MNEQRQSPQREQQPLTALTSMVPLPLIATSYFAAVGMAYHAPYWSTFGVNILHYAGLSDLLRLSVGPLGLVGFGYASTAVFYGIYARRAERVSPESTEKVVAKALVDYFPLLYYVAGLALIVYGWIIYAPWRHLLVPVLMGSAIVRFGYWVIGKLFPEVPARQATLGAVLFFLLPVVACTAGWTDADFVKTGQRYQRFVPRDGIYRELVSDDLRYLGRTSEAILVYDPRSTDVVVLERDSVSLYQLHSVR